MCAAQATALERTGHGQGECVGSVSLRSEKHLPHMGQPARFVEELQT